MLVSHSPSPDAGAGEYSGPNLGTDSLYPFNPKMNQEQDLLFRFVDRYSFRDDRERSYIEPDISLSGPRVVCLATNAAHDPFTAKTYPHPLGNQVARFQWALDGNSGMTVPPATICYVFRRDDLTAGGISLHTFAGNRRRFTDASSVEMMQALGVNHFDWAVTPDRIPVELAWEVRGWQETEGLWRVEECAGRMISAT